MVLYWILAKWANVSWGNVFFSDSESFEKYVISEEKTNLNFLHFTRVTKIKAAIFLVMSIGLENSLLIPEHCAHGLKNHRDLYRVG